MTECYPETLQLRRQDVRGQGASRGYGDSHLHGQAHGRGQAVGGQERGAARGHRARGWGGGNSAGQRNRRSENQWQYPPPPGWNDQRGFGWSGDRYWRYPADRGFGGGYNRGRF